MALQHLRSSTADKRPTPAAMSDGQLALNTNLVSPGLFFKDSNGDSVKIGPVHVGTTAPNVTPGAGGQAGNSKGEQWLDTSSSRYVFKIWDGTAWRSEDGEFVNVSGDTMTGALGIIAGTAAAPGVFFSGDPNTGIYSPGADQVAVSTGGTGRLFVDASGNVGVGTSPAVARINLSASGAGIPAIQFTDNANATGRIGTPSSGLVAFGGNTDHAIAFGGWASDNFTSERLRITSAGLVGIGTTSPGSRLEVNDTNCIVKSKGTAGYGSFYAEGSTGNAAFYFLGVNGTETARLISDSGNYLAFGTGSSGLEKARIDSSGRLLVGTSSALATAFGSISPRFQVATSTSGPVSFLSYAADAFGARLDLSKSRAATVGTNTVVQSDDDLGEIYFNGADGTNLIPAALIRVEVDGTPGANDMPGRLVFSVTADGAASPTEAMRIKSTRIVNIANTPVHADNAAAKTAGLVDGDVYRKSDGTMMIVFT